ncbi:DUF3060 domain-containing protein [Pseudochelatococcus contaminans]|uniref:DUF3060 domain-containing protein n=1 Tax=Pseudochelatococcus contaminans TaxID=1538103 RepID=A0A7W5Z1M1_9HYPH|nr:DUF3060 domain-containing protein [Pseudochelatococcus contaminans]MBB3808333.1 hypothetical protein [Pseudochelatococcus contaminans]
MLFRLVITGCLLASTSALAARELVVRGDNLTQTVRCDGHDVDIFGAGNRVSITGECRSIDVKGNRHTVTFEDVDDLDIEGAESTVRGGEANSVDIEGRRNKVEVAIDGEDESGELDISGSENHARITVLSSIEIDVEGDSNRVEWSAATGVPEPVVSTEGRNNQVTRVNR